MFVQKFKFILMKMHKKLLPPELLLLAQICTKSFVGWGFTYSAPPDPLSGLGGGDPGKMEGGRGCEKERGMGRRGEEGVPECPNPELASLLVPRRLGIGLVAEICTSSTRLQACTHYLTLY